MKRYYNKAVKVIYLAILLSGVMFVNPVYADLKSYSDWKDADAYKPRPVLFLHGFASGDPDSWKKATASLEKYFTAYQSIGPFLPDSFSYLERINFQDPNGSIDTYDDGRDGWADKVNAKAPLILDAYGTDKLNLVCHSMGGLAAREYLTNTKYSSLGSDVENLITIGTPHVGSSWANLANGISKAQRLGFNFSILGWVETISVGGLDLVIAIQLKTDIDGEAVQDMAIDSSFLKQLNTRSKPDGTDYVFIYGMKKHRFNRYLFNNYEGGDKMVSANSQRGLRELGGGLTERVIGCRDPKAEAPIAAFHTEEINVAAESGLLLNFLDSTKPVVVITSPNPQADPLEVIHTKTITVEGTIKEEYLPADTEIKIKVVRDADGVEVMPEETYKEAVRPFADSYPTPAGFKIEDVNLCGEDGTLKEGRYTISVVATNPAGVLSDEVTTQVEVELNEPVIEWVGPTGSNWVVSHLSAKIYSPDRVDIDLLSLEMKLDGNLVSIDSIDIRSTYLKNKSDIIVHSYVVPHLLTTARHTVSLKVKDVNGLATEANWEFEKPPLESAVYFYDQPDNFVAHPHAREYFGVLKLVISMTAYGKPFTVPIYVKVDDKEEVVIAQVPARTGDLEIQINYGTFLPAENIRLRIFRGWWSDLEKGWIYVHGNARATYYSP